jgi:Adenylate and Guanylate cyclase catalytic domain
MPDDATPKRLEIGHVLFIDIVGYSKLLSDAQAEALHELNQLVRETESFREADAAGKLVPLPTGDGMALVFRNSVEAPVECALELSQALRRKPSLPVRMGIHSGPVHQVEDVNERNNIAGAGINIAQRVMDCGDAGHILISKRVADDLAQSRRWQPYLHELGDAEVKHGLVVSIVNLYADVIGNPNPPAKFGGARSARAKSGEKKQPRSYSPLVYIIPIVLVIIPAIIFAPAIMHSVKKKTAAPPPIPSPPAISQPVAPGTSSLGDQITNMVTKNVEDQLKKIPAEIKAATTKAAGTPGVSPSPQQSETPGPEQNP